MNDDMPWHCVYHREAAAEVRELTAELRVKADRIRELEMGNDRLRTIVEEAFGLHVLDQGDDWLSVLERRLFEERQKHSKALSERDAYREQCEDLATQLERALSAYSTAASEADRAGAAELALTQAAKARAPAQPGPPAPPVQCALHYRPLPCPACASVVSR